MKEKNKTDKDNKKNWDVLNDLMTAIAKGILKPGQRLVEMQLCEQYGVKRSKVREALRKLEHDGVVRITRNVGAFVAENSQRDIEEMYDILGTLDGLAVKIVTQFITPGQIEELEKIINKMETTDKPAMLVKYNHEFHSLLCSFCENKRLIKLTENLKLNIGIFTFRNFSFQAQVDASISDHKKIIEAIKEGDPEKAEALMRRHVTAAKYRLIKWMNKSL